MAQGREAYEVSQDAEYEEWVITTHEVDEHGCYPGQWQAEQEATDSD